MITYKQLTLVDIFEECQEIFDSDKPRFLTLLENHIDLDSIIPVSFYQHYYSSSLKEFCGFSKVPDASKITRFKQDFLSDLQSVFENLVDLTEPICRAIDSAKAAYGSMPSHAAANDILGLKHPPSLSTAIKFMLF